MSDDRSYPDIDFVETDTDTITKAMISAYETITDRTLYPADPARLFILWAADIIVQERSLINQSAKQNIPRYAEGDYLDSLAELFKDFYRLEAATATTTLRFTISGVLTSSQLVPSGTRVSTLDGDIVFETTADAYVPAGSLYVDAAAKCQTVGTSGNGLVAGQISTIVDVFPYFASVANTTTSEGGSEAEDDASFYERMRENEDSYSTAGSVGAYVYHAKSVSTSIADVTVLSPSAGYISVYVLLEGGELPGPEMISDVEDALSADDVRPLTDNVTVLAPGTVSYNINFTYYIPSSSALSASVIEEAVATAVASYKEWQCAVMGRDVNPSKLIALLMQTGIKRVDVTAPVYAAVGESEVAAIGTENIVNGGYENE